MANELVKEMAFLTRLPEDEITGEIEKILEGNALDPDAVNLDEFRQAMLNYLDEIFASETTLDEISGAA